MASIEVLSHWYQLLDGLQQSPQEFYGALEEAISRRSIPDATTVRIEHPEGGMFSGKREYLRVSRREHKFDICAAPFGAGFFVSWWLFSEPGCVSGCLMAVPGLNIAFATLVKRVTYWSLDSALMFQSAVHTAVLEVIDGLTSVQGVRALSELDRKPILREFYAR